MPKHSARTRREHLEAITDPRQRAVAAAADECVRVFLPDAEGLPPGLRLVEQSASPDGDPAVRQRNALRLFAVGLLGCLGRALGLTWSELAGQTKGCRTQVPDLEPLHRNTVVGASALFETLRTSRCELGEMAAARYRAVLAECRRQIREKRRGRVRASGRRPAGGRVRVTARGLALPVPPRDPDGEDLSASAE
jgi:hypothetical protein